MVDNHVVRYTPPEEYAKSIGGMKRPSHYKPKGSLVVGAESTNPDRVLNNKALPGFLMNILHIQKNDRFYFVPLVYQAIL